MQDNSAPYGGSILHESRMPNYSVGFRHHVVDPIRFTTSLRVTIEHGHANHLSDDWSSTAYWYQTEPSGSSHIASVTDRLPTRVTDPSSGSPHRGDPLPAVSTEIAALRAQQEERVRVYEEHMAQRIATRVELTREGERGSREGAAAIRKSFH